MMHKSGEKKKSVNATETKSRAASIKPQKSNPAIPSAQAAVIARSEAASAAKKKKKKGGFCCFGPSRTDSDEQVERTPMSNGHMELHSGNGVDIPKGYSRFKNQNKSNS